MDLSFKKEKKKLRNKIILNRLASVYFISLHSSVKFKKYTFFIFRFDFKKYIIRYNTYLFCIIIIKIYLHTFS